MTESTIEIKGRVVHTDADHTATPYKTVELWLSTAATADPLATATTTADGAFEVVVERASLPELGGYLFLKLYSGNELLTEVHPVVDLDDAEAVEEIEIVLPPRAPAPPPVPSTDTATGEPASSARPNPLFTPLRNLFRQPVAPTVEPPTPVTPVPVRAAERTRSLRLCDRTTNQPLTNQQVRAFLVTPDGTRTHLGTQRLDASGRMAIELPDSSQDAAEGRSRLRLEILEEASPQVTRLDISLDGRTSLATEVVVLAEIPDLNPTIQRLAQTLKINQPEQIANALKARNIQNLEDVRKRGGDLKDLQGVVDPNILQQLQAQSDLSVLSYEPKEREKLLQKGFATPVSIAQTNQDRFVKQLAETIDTERALEIHRVATAQTQWLTSIATGIRADKANHLHNTYASLLPDQPEDPDRPHALSPAAYLADLLDYTWKHVYNGDKPIGLTFLETTFHQPFSRLPLSSPEAEKTVRQVRLCVEVLRSYGKSLNRTLSPAAQQTYLQQAYETLLLRIGTSFSELRLARGATQKEREALANRLGLDSPDRLTQLLLTGNTLTEASLQTIFGLVDTTTDPLAPTTTPALQTWRLQQLRNQWRGQDWPIFRFALKVNNATDASKNHISVGAIAPLNNGSIHDDLRAAFNKFGIYVSSQTPVKVRAIAPDKLWFIQYQNDHYRVEQTTNKDGLKYLKVFQQPLFPIIDPDVIGPDDFRVPFPKQQLIPSPQLESIPGASQPGTPGTIRPSVSPIAPSPLFPDAPYKPFKLWVQRRNWVDAQLKALKDQASLEAMLQLMVQVVKYGETQQIPWSALGTAAASGLDLLNTLAQYLADLTPDTETTLHLPLNACSRLRELLTQYRVAPSADRKKALTPEEWQELRTILVQAQKRCFLDVWCREEVTQGIELSPETFWFPAGEPQVGTWPPEPATQPWIDPEKQSLNDLPEFVAGRQARELWRSRSDRLKTLRDEQRSTRISQGILEALLAALGDSALKALPDELTALNKSLASSDPPKAEKYIQDNLHMSMDGFKRLVAILLKVVNQDPAKQPTEAEWNELDRILTPMLRPDDLSLQLPDWLTNMAKQLKKAMPSPSKRVLPYDLDALSRALSSANTEEEKAKVRSQIETDLYLSVEAFTRLIAIWEKAKKSDVSQPEWEEFDRILTTARKGKREYPNWIKEEQQQPGQYWYAQKAKLDPWLVPGGSRSDWQTVLRSRSQPPLIDPDVIWGLELQHLESGNPEYDLWWQRWNDLDRELKILKNKRAAQTTPISGLEAILRYANISLDTLKQLAEVEAEGYDIQPRLAQLRLTRAGYLHLLRLEQLIAQDPANIQDSDWEDAYAILVQAKKLGWYPTWQQQEQEYNLLLSPDYFTLARSVQKPELPKWRASQSDYWDWQERLQGRIDQEAAVIAGLEETVSATEQIALPKLRDALVDTTGQAGMTHEQRADLAARRLLIETQNDGSRQTTRIGQAIETLQGLVFGIQTAQIAETYPHLRLETPDFYQEWQWLGTYANWRAAMFIFLYPENLLDPGFLRALSPLLRNLLGNLGNNLSIEPSQISKVAKETEETLLTLRDLQVVQQYHVFSKEAPGKQQTFLFAQCNNRTFWCGWERNQDPLLQWIQRSYWVEIPTIRGELLGVTCLFKPDKPHYLYAIFKEKRTSGWVVGYSRCDLSTISFDPDRQLETGCWEQASINEAEIFQNLFFAAETRHYSEQERYFPLPFLIELKTEDTSLSGSKVFTFRKIPLYSDGTWGTPINLRSSQTLSADAEILFCDCESKACISFVCRSFYEYLLFTIDESGTFSGPTTIFKSVPEGSYRDALVGVLQWQKVQPYFPPPRLVIVYRDAQRSDLAATCCAFENGSKLGSVRMEIQDPLPTALRLLGDYWSKSILYKNVHGAWEYSYWYYSWDTPEGTVIPKNPVRISLPPPFDCSITPGCAEAPVIVTRISELLRIAQSSSDLICQYAAETSYFIPLLFAQKLQRAGYYVEALDWYRSIYDYTAPVGSRKQAWLKFKDQAQTETSFDRPDDWLKDPLNPHGLATTRASAYTRFTLFSIIRCLLEFADSEFSQDTAESLPRAQMLYETAQTLLDSPELKPETDETTRVILQLANEVESLNLQFLWPQIESSLSRIKDVNQLSAATQRISRAMNDGTSITERATNTLAALPKSRQGTLTTVQQILATPGANHETTYRSLLQQDHLFQNATNALNATTVNTIPPPLGQLSFQFSIPPNPVLEMLRLHVESSLRKLRTGRNIAGIQRQVDPYAASTDTTTGLPYIGSGGQLVLPGIALFMPVQYRYKTLIERARQLVAHAQHVEAEMLSALEKRETAAYEILKARQDIRVMGETVRLQRLRVSEAEASKELAKTQKVAADARSEHFRILIETGWFAAENDYMNALIAIASQYQFLAGGSAVVGAVAFYGGGAFFGGQMMEKAINYQIQAQQALANILQFKASLERRCEEWSFQKTLADQDSTVAANQITVAQDHVDVVDQEQKIAELQTQNAKDIVEFLSKKFTNVELYDWMINILTDIYAYFLQQATAMAKTAASQLAFERQETPPNFIQSDYWQISESALTAVGGEKEEDRRGLTGSARLLRDIEKLDLYAFQTDARRLHLKRSISLTALFPLEFEKFRQTGVITFPTPMELFDRDQPGHYLRLIHRVSVSVIALIPPTSGIHASLTTTGQSRIVVGGDIFQTIQMHRSPEQIALSSPANDTGVFELDPQAEILRPFEGIGVDTIWEFRMPKPANQFDYSTLADVILTLEYTARHNYDYQQLVIQQLSPTLSSDRAFSFKNQFADAWYNLSNPDRSSTPMTVQFTTRREDFAPNYDRLRLEQVVLYFVRPDDATFEVAVEHLHFTAQGSNGAIGGAATSINGIISTRRGNASSWTAMLGKVPFGTWELSLPNTAEMKQLFANDQIEDILFVLTYEGRTPAWPA